MAKEKSERGVSRRNFMRISGPVAAGALGVKTGFSKDLAAGQRQTEGTQKFSLQNEQFRLGISPNEGLQVLLHHLPTGIELANGPYSFSFGAPKMGPPVKT